MPQPERILHVLSGLNRGGAETMVMNLYKAIDRRRYQFDFAVWTRGDYADAAQALGAAVHLLPRPGPTSARRYVAAWRGLLAEHPEYRLVHGHLRSTASVYLTMARRRGRVAVAHSHGTSSGRGGEALVKNILQYPIRHTADYLLACTDDAGLWLYGRRAAEGDNYLVLPNAVDAAAFAFDPAKRAAARAELGCGDRLVLGHVGAFLPNKNHRFMLDVLAALRRGGVDALLLLVGDGPLLPETVDDARRRGLHSHVIFTGERGDVAPLLHGMDAFMLPSRREGLPMAALEAQAAGLPCLLSDTVTRRAAVTPLATFLPVGDPELWADALARRRAGTARGDMTGAFKAAGCDIGDSAARLEAFYDRALSRAGTAGPGAAP